MLIRPVDMLVSAHKDGKLLAEYPIGIGYANASAPEAEYIDQAKEQLLDDGLATEEDLEGITFKIIPRKQ